MNEWFIHSSIEGGYIRSRVYQIGQITLKPHEAGVFVVNQMWSGIDVIRVLLQEAREKLEGSVS